MNQRATVALIAILGALGIWNSWRAHVMSAEVKILQEKLNENSALMKSGTNIDSPDSETAKIEKTGQKKTDVQVEKEGDDASFKGSNPWKSRSQNFGLARSSTPKTKEVTDVLSALSHPDVQERIGNISKSMAKKQENSKWQAKKEVNKEARQFELQSFADEKGYDDGVKSQLNEAIDKYSEESTNIWMRVNDGEISWMDARGEWKDLKEDRQAQITNLIGEGDYDELQERVWGKWR